MWPSRLIFSNTRSHIFKYPVYTIHKDWWQDVVVFFNPILKIVQYMSSRSATSSMSHSIPSFAAVSTISSFVVGYFFKLQESSKGCITTFHVPYPPSMSSATSNPRPHLFPSPPSMLQYAMHSVQSLFFFAIIHPPRYTRRSVAFTNSLFIFPIDLANLFIKIDGGNVLAFLLIICQM